jgi:hypothetical protein
VAKEWRGMAGAMSPNDDSLIESFRFIREQVVRILQRNQYPHVAAAVIVALEQIADRIRDDHGYAVDTDSPLINACKGRGR